MLVLSRKNGQKLIIDDKIEIVIIESSYNAVKLGIVAPKDVTVLREEIYQEIIKNNNGAKQTSVASLNQLNTLFEKKKIVKDGLKD
ncbi:MAG: carbon storage regulator CsrA [Candidatus Gastranaerophilales bacterium]|nr:carbon storage regulator CsrA [Candidatus Gastranaerophilales bacterium]